MQLKKNPNLLNDLLYAFYLFAYFLHFLLICHRKWKFSFRQTHLLMNANEIKLGFINSGFFYFITFYKYISYC